FDARFVNFNIGVPDLQGSRIWLTEGHGALQCGVVTRGHRETVHGQQIATLPFTGGGPDVYAVGVNARLEPYPGVTDLLIGEGLGNLMDHGFLADERHFVFGDAFTNSGVDGFATDVTDTGTVFDDFDFFLGLDHALTHSGLRNVNEFRIGESICKGCALHSGHGVVFNTKAFGFDALAVQRFLETVVEVVAAPIGVDDIVAVAGAPWHTGVNIGGYGNRFFLSHDQRVLTSEVREQEIRVV